MCLLAAPVGIGYFGIDPVSEQKGLAPSDGCHVQNRLSMMIFHDQHQVGLTNVLDAELGGAVRPEIEALKGKQGLRVLVGRVIDQRIHAR